MPEEGRRLTSFRWAQLYTDRQVLELTSPLVGGGPLARRIIP